MQKTNVKIIAVAAVVIAICLLFSWATVPQDDGRNASTPIAEGILDGDLQEAYDSLSPELREAFEAAGGYDAFRTTVDSQVAVLEAQYGPALGITDSYEAGDGISCSVMEFQYSGMLLWAHDSGDGVDSFYLTPRDLPSDQPVPGGITETPVQVGAQGLPALDGLLASSEDSDHSVAVVLVSGSGPNGMNCAVGHNQIFQQLAWGLAEHGVDVLRYDDRTYAYPWDSMALGNALDIDYETVDDAVSAASLLKSMGYEKVYVVGHSLGAMMAPAIVERSEGMYDGMVSLAGSPRSLAEISYDQNMLTIDQMPDGPEKDAMVALLDQEMAVYGTIGTMSEEQLLTTTVFGMSAYYLKSMDDYDVPAIAQNLDVPMLFLQSTSDWQVTYHNDYLAWLEILDGRENVQSQAYMGLNHLFCIPGAYDGTPADYYLSVMTVNQSVVEDIAEFVLTS